MLDYLEKHLPAKNLNLLEINCGTGEDALWLAKKGHRVVCTDVSASMLEIVKAKVSNAKLEKKITIQQLDLTKIESWETTEKYDIIFSNFAGLNCLNPTELQVTLAELSKLLKPNGQLILVFLGRFCAWETKYFLLKGTWKSAFRRMNKEAVFADVDGVKQIICDHGGNGLGRATFEHGDYRTLALEPESFDLLISLYAGFISEACGHLLRVGGILLVNSSDGDAALAALDERFELKAVVTSSDGRYAVTNTNLDSYMVPKKPQPITAEKLKTSGRGIAYTKTPFAYLFKRVR